MESADVPLPRSHRPEQTKTGGDASEEERSVRIRVRQQTGPRQVLINCQ